MITQEILQAKYLYEPLTGLFHHKIPSRNIKIGDIAGSIQPNGYIRLRFNNKMYNAARMAWLYMTGEPVDTSLHMDHINRNRADNRIANLRPVTKSINEHNKPIGRGYDISTAGRYSPRICVDGKIRYLGTYDTVEEATKIFLEAKQKYQPTESIKCVTYF